MNPPPPNLSEFSLERLLGLPPLRNVASVPEPEAGAGPLPPPRETQRVQWANQKRAAEAGTRHAARRDVPLPPRRAEAEEPAENAAATSGLLLPVTMPPVFGSSAATITYDAVRGVQLTSLDDGTTFIDLYDPQAFFRPPAVSVH
jgi:hypothetical protein